MRYLKVPKNKGGIIMAELRITPAEVRKKVEELRNLNNQFKTKVEALQSSENTLVSMWEGDSRNEFHNKFTIERGKLDNFYAGIEQYATALYNISVEHDNKENSNVTIAQSLS